MNDSLHGIRIAASRFGVSIMTTRRLLKSGAVRGVRVGKRWLISGTEIDRVVKNGTN